MTTVVAVTGKKGAGKDSVAKHFFDTGYEKIRFADPLKDMLAVIFTYYGYDQDMIYRLIEGDLKEAPCDALKGKTPRYAMQTLGTEWRNMIAEDLWTAIIKRRMSFDPPEKIVITDLRFPHEQTTLNEFKGTLIRVYRPIGRTDEGLEHPSETLIDSLVPDIEVFNYGSLEDLEDAVTIIRLAIEGRISVLDTANGQAN